VGRFADRKRHYGHTWIRYIVKLSVMKCTHEISFELGVNHINVTNAVNGKEKIVTTTELRAMPSKCENADTAGVRIL